MALSLLRMNAWKGGSPPEAGGAAPPPARDPAALRMNPRTPQMPQTRIPPAAPATQMAPGVRELLQDRGLRCVRWLCRCVRWLHLKTHCHDAFTGSAASAAGDSGAGRCKQVVQDNHAHGHSEQVHGPGGIHSESAGTTQRGLRRQTGASKPFLESYQADQKSCSCSCKRVIPKGFPPIARSISAEEGRCLGRLWGTQPEFRGNVCV